MAAYVISDLEVRDPALVEEYRRLADPSLQRTSRHHPGSRRSKQCKRF
jgi:uncharacterized protein (DUF1330 family)